MVVIDNFRVLNLNLSIKLVLKIWSLRRMETNSSTLWTTSQDRFPPDIHIVLNYWHCAETRIFYSLYISSNKQCFASWCRIGSTSHEVSRINLRYFLNICVRYEVSFCRVIPTTRGELLRANGGLVASTGQIYSDERYIY